MEIAVKGSGYHAASSADALVVLTDSEEFGEPRRSAPQLMRYPLIVHGRPLRMSELGFHYLSIGRPDVIPERSEQTRPSLLKAS